MKTRVYVVTGIMLCMFGLLAVRLAFLAGKGSVENKDSDQFPKPPSYKLEPVEDESVSETEVDDSTFEVKGITFSFDKGHKLNLVPKSQSENPNPNKG